MGRDCTQEPVQPVELKGDSLPSSSLSLSFSVYYFVSFSWADTQTCHYILTLVSFFLSMLLWTLSS